jgi:hypothetical protein
MSRWVKWIMVLSGYGLAFFASVLAVAIYDRRFTAADNQAMGGMIAGGEMIYGIGVFVLASLVPTGLALWFVRRHRPTWSAFSTVCLAFAVAGLGAVASVIVTRGATRPGIMMLVDLFGLFQTLGSPLWIGAFALFALLAPARDLRRRMLVAAAIEVVIAGCGLLLFLLQPSRI